jgi:hypothetical protein
MRDTHSLQIRFLAGLLIFFLFFMNNTPFSSSQESSSGSSGESSDDQMTYTVFSERLKDAESLLEEGGPVSIEDIMRLEEWLQKLENTPYRDLTAKTRMLIFLLNQRNGSLSSTASESTNSDRETPDWPSVEARTPGRGREIAQWVTFSLGVSCLGLFNLFWYLGDRSYEEFLNADSSSELDRLQQVTNTYDTLSYVFGGIGLVSLVAWIILLATGPVSSSAE